MDLGSRIKYHRKKQQMELEELAADLLSPVELKKIELGSIAPSAELHKALCEKLAIPTSPVENPIGQELISQFKELLLHPQDRMAIRELYSMISEHPLLNIDEEIELECNIQLVRFFVVTGDMDSAEEKIAELESLKEFMNQYQYYLYHKYCGNFHYVMGECETALNLYLLSEKIAPSNIKSVECADLYYSIAISGIQVHKNEMADKYSRMALAIYEEEFIPKRIIECHINLGITQQRLKNLKLALDHLQTARKIAKKLGINSLLYISEFNCGLFYYFHGDFQLAIHHMENALEYIPKEYMSDILAGYCPLIKCNLELTNHEVLLKWLTKGKNLINTNNSNLEASGDHKFSEAYYEFLCLQGFYDEDYQNFETNLIQHLIPILKADKNYSELAYYYNKLGNVYLKLGKYKKSAIILNKAQEAFKNLIIYS